jgi:recombination protein RecR
MILPAPIQNLIDALSRLPGVGPKTASRLTFFLLNAPDELSGSLAEALRNLKSSTAYCQICFNITMAGRTECEICANPDRDARLICVVEEPLDVIAIERTDGFQGRYHVLHGALSPIEGIGPEDLKIRPLIDRVREGGVQEVILATNPSMEGDATAMYIDIIGLPVGGTWSEHCSASDWENREMVLENDKKFSAGSLDKMARMRII